MSREGVLCAGTILVDVAKVIDAYPALDHLAMIEQVSLSTGGPGLNMAVDLRMLGAAFPIGVLGAVGDDDRLAPPGGDRAHLLAGGEASPAPAGEPGALNQVDQALGPLPAGPVMLRGLCGQRQRPVQLLVLAQPGGMVVGDAGEQAGQPQLRRTVGGQCDRGHRAPARAAETKRQVAAPVTTATLPFRRSAISIPSLANAIG